METERLILKPITTDDAEFLFELYNSPHFLEFIGDRNIKNFEAAAEYIEARFLPQLERLGYGNYVIIRKSDGQKIGAVGVYEREGLEVQDIGFSFLPAFEGQGYGFEAASKVLETVFNDYKVKKISAITSKVNFASQNLIKKLGLKYIKNVLLPGDEEELLYFEIQNPTL